MVGRGSDGYHLRVRGWILKAFNLIVPPADDLAILYHDCTNRDFILLEGSLSFLQGEFHPLFVLCHLFCGVS